jgi:hypothetical protein
MASNPSPVEVEANWGWGDAVVVLSLLPQS